MVSEDEKSGISKRPSMVCLLPFGHSMESQIVYRKIWIQSVAERGNIYFSTAGDLVTGLVYRHI